MADERQAYEAILGQCAAIMDTLGYTGAAYLVDTPESTITPQQCAVMVRPGRASVPMGESGVGLMQCRFQTILWWRNPMDYADRANYRVTGDAGAMRTMWYLRYGNGGVPGIVGSFLLSQSVELVEPLLPDDLGAAEQVPGHTGWLRVTDSYRFSIPFDWTTNGE